MTHKFLITAAAAAILASGGIASAQAPKQDPNAPAAQEKAQKPAPAPAMKEGSATRDKAAPSTTGQGSPAGSSMDKSSMDKAGSSMDKRDKSAGDKAEKSDRSGRQGTSGQGSSSQAKEPSKSTQGQSREPAKSSASPATQDKSNAESGSASSSSSGASNTTNVNVNLTTQQRERIRTTVLKQSNAPRVAHVDFSVSIGTAVPRTVHLAPVPAVIVEVAPAWRGYEYFIVGDEIVIVNPRTLRIVAVIAA